jgi:hypothetical protein
MLLDLVRKVELRPGGDGVFVRVEDHRRIGPGSVTELLPDPTNPQSWRREPVRRRGTDRTGRRPVGVYAILDGVFEGKSVRRGRVGFVTYFTVRDGSVEVLGHSGDEEIVLARLRAQESELVAEGATPDTAPDDGLPALEGGSFRQRHFAAALRRHLLDRAACDPELAAKLRTITSAVYFIAASKRTLAEIKTRLHAPEWDSRRAEMTDAPPPGEPGPPW